MKLYIAYDQGSARDRTHYAALERALKPLVRNQSVRIKPRPASIPSKNQGGSWFRAYTAAMEDADIILVLVSTHYLAKDEPAQELRACRESVFNQTNKSIIFIPIAPFSFSGTGLKPSEFRWPQPGVFLTELEEPLQERFWSDLVSHLRSPGAEENLSLDGVGQPYYLKSLTLKEFKCFEQLHLEFDHPSPLGGRWHCIAGINGAGKSSILEAVSLCLLGPERAQALGPKLIGRKCRNGQKAQITAEVLDTSTGKAHQLRVNLHPDGLDLRDALSANGMQQIWDQLALTLFMGFGATRDFSENKKPEDRLGEEIRRHLSLFDPLEPPVDDVQVLKGIDRNDFLALLQQMLNLLPEAFQIKAGISPFNQLLFEQHNREIPLLELPSGLRSLVIWFTGLVREWCRVAPKQAANQELASIRGLVLLDEIDLHLHPKLQRIIVPQLRKQLPGVQWIVTTHSPLVIASFDQHELTWLNQEGQVTPLDRQVIGFTPDQIIRHLMDTNPESEILAAYHRFQDSISKGETPNEADVLPPELLTEVMNQAQYPELDAAAAQERLAWWRKQVKAFNKASTKP
ncbi:AAA family ATPase [Acanthopleuribacter pedis]|uniref:AAA family ATPase n=1 Tax=Acanthopleuribacter pedis TaxID=442870 RepID=A0A8J7QCU4_9BACT|nr:AAA family ATPase [Acanthopleuribacter pedis]MBO1321424.1 AAA family ATPase [Acanthopleuribacter pedis]